MIPKDAITVDTITALFDRRVEEGIINYDANQQIEKAVVDGFPVEIRVCVLHANKPSFGENRTGRQTSNSTTPRSRDIDVSGFEIAAVGTTHILAFNMFAAYRPHALLLAQDPIRVQIESLDASDLTATWEVVSRLGDEFIALYNCGVRGGCSRITKHVQIIPRDGHPLWPDLPGKDRPALPFRYFETWVEGMAAEDVVGAHDRLVVKTRAAMGIGAGHFPHNVILTTRWLIMVPRRHASLNGATANAVGFLGMFWVRFPADRDRFMEEGGVPEVLRHCGYEP